ncbi:RES domain-containing protein [Hyunsoonleella ulvae]|uniref:RES domain-containing protein n=1 Tax=Hyunsoonleella ulvae TaxID=2799948 RepID=UPI0019399105|nr:RES domain-containing protein [Hyunsoonleella ulvae]
MKKFEEVIRSKSLNLNEDNSYSGSFRDYFNSRLDEYLDLISLLDVSTIDFKKHKSTNRGINLNQTDLVEGLKETIAYYYDGNPAKAYNRLKKAIDQRLKRYRGLLKIGEYSLGEDFYRIRITKGNSSYNSKNFFHIPFDLRGKVSTQRFSIPGFPSLYLGRTAYVCWEELNRPNLSDFHVVRLESIEKIKFIDLAPPYLNSNINDIEYYKYLMTWPLIFACTIKVKHPDEVFKPEYVIPQLLLQWTRQEKEIDGIRYWSTHIQHSPLSFKGELYNIVLPVKENLTEGLCPQLTNIFEATEVVSWQSIELATGGQTYLYSDKENEKIDKKMEYLELIKGTKYPYSSSVFGNIERQLSFLPSKRISS